jgi:Holliday junction resolvase RusA-like endonuclease
MDDIFLTVLGKPVPKGRPRMTMRGTFPHAYTPKRTVQYEQSVALAARALRRKVFGAVNVLIVLFFTHTRTSGEWPGGDVDNYAKSILDGIVQGGLLKDDDQVVSLRVEKQWGEPARAEVLITERLSKGGDR